MVKEVPFVPDTFDFLTPLISLAHVGARSDPSLAAWCGDWARSHRIKLDVTRGLSIIGCNVAEIPGEVQFISRQPLGVDISNNVSLRSGCVAIKSCHKSSASGAPAMSEAWCP
jgi:hypothetical protein